MGHEEAKQTETRWVLAFDASCGSCREISATVARAGGGKLEVLPLAHPDVERWRSRALGSDAPWAPTLIEADADGPVRAWTRGPVMGLRLATRLGPRSVMQVLSALGELRRAADSEARRSAREDSGGAAMGRAAFLRLAAGIGAAAGLVLLGRTPAFAAPESAAARWARANQERLPQNYDELAAYPMDYRRAITSRLTPEARSRLWVEHLDRSRVAYPHLTAEQRSILDRATALASDPSTFAMDDAQRSEALPDLRRLSEQAVAAFGQDEATAMLATLGPTSAETSSKAWSVPDDVTVPACECSGDFVICNCGFCNSCDTFLRGFCFGTTSGCGFLWGFECDGRCNGGAGCPC